MDDLSFVKGYHKPEELKNIVLSPTYENFQKLMKHKKITGIRKKNTWRNVKAGLKAGTMLIVKTGNELHFATRGHSNGGVPLEKAAT